MQTRNVFLHAFALAGGLTLGCVITTGDGDLDDGDCPGANNHEFLDECFCDAGYEWENPNDPNDLTCVPEMAKEGDCSEPHNILIGNECHCDEQYTWCNDDPNDFSCCVDEGHNGDTGGDTGSDDVADTGDTGVETGTDTADTGVDTGTDPTDTGVEPDPADCTEDGLSFCSNTEEQGPEGSRYWVCTGGEWVEDTEAGDAACQFDQYDFAYGCVATESAVEFVCGEGPGTDCEGDAATCADADIISYCFMGKLTEDSCLRICMEEGDDMDVTYDYGECSADTNECFCCDEGEEGCPAGM